jgi:SAM-dependent methyltransferase
LAKQVFYPGLDWHIRQRGRAVRPYVKQVEGTRTLDAGCGNGYFSFAACDFGHRVRAISIDSDAIARAKEYRSFLNYSPDLVQFEVMNLYDLGRLKEAFQQIFCLETLEHIRDDRRVLQLFHQRLVPGGDLILGVPNRAAPPLYGETLSVSEDGGHVRQGYTFVELDHLLSECGFRVKAHSCYGRGATRMAVNIQRRLTIWSAGLGRWSALLCAGVQAAAFLSVAPIVAVDRLSRGEPISILVVAERVP